MSDEKISLVLEPRKVQGKGLGKLRGDGKIPAVIHNHGKDSIVVEGSYLEMVRIYSEAGRTHPIEVKVGDQDFLTIIKTVDFEPKKHTLRHVVFGAIDRNAKVETEVPVELVGEEIPAEIAGHMVITNIDHVLIEALPNNLIDKLTVDATGLTEVGDKLHVSDLVAPSGVTILTEPEQTIATVEMPKAEISEEAEEEGEEGEGVEGEEGESSEGGSDDKESKDGDSKPEDSKEDE